MPAPTRQGATSSAEADGAKNALGNRRSKRRRRRKRGKRGASDQPALAANGETRPDSRGANTELGNDGAKRRSGKPKRHKPNGAQASNGKSPPARPDNHRNQAPNGRPPAPHVQNARQAATAYAALDLGTNNCRLLVAVPGRPGTFRVIDAFSRIVRLGEGLGATGQLSDAAMERAVGALKVCREKLTARPIERMRLIATEACRQAENGHTFLDRVRQEAELDLEVVDRATEARLAVSGCGSLVDREARSTLLFDIGGGSSEIALIDLAGARPRRLADNIIDWTSLPVGVVTMAEKFGGRDVNAETFAAMTAHAEDLLADFAGRNMHLARNQDSAFHLIGTSGTVTTLAGLHLGLKRYDRRRVDGLWMSAPQVDQINQQLLSWSFDERVANPCIGKDRADLVLAGCAILQAIRNIWPAPRLRVADRGLREGLLTEMMAADGVWRRNRYRRGRNGAQR